MKTGLIDGDYLLVDAAGPVVQTALWRHGSWIEWQGSRDEAGRALFAGAEKIFRGNQCTLYDLKGYFFCEGPGSMLGIRIAAMAIRGWQTLRQSPLPVFVYGSHDILARILLARAIAPPFHVIGDARRNLWNVTSVNPDRSIAPLRQIDDEEISALEGTFYRMEEEIRRDPPVAISELLPYNLKDAAEHFCESGFLRREETADVMNQKPPEYKRWNAERHR